MLYFISLQVHLSHGISSPTKYLVMYISQFNLLCFYAISCLEAIREDKNKEDINSHVILSKSVQSFCNHNILFKHTSLANIKVMPYCNHKDFLTTSSPASAKCTLVFWIHSRYSHR